MIWKILLVLFFILVVGYFYVSKVANGKLTGSLPAGYTAIESNNYTFSTRINGNPQDTAVILLHGFPESAAMWTKTLLDLNEKGYYTIAPNQRGYSFGARPQKKSAYQIDQLAEDVIALANALDISKFHLIGHDWGSAVGWQLAATYPDRLYSYVSLSVPHMTAFTRAYLEDSLQYQASSYIRQIQYPKLPEFILARNDYQLLEMAWSAHEQEEIEQYLALFKQKGALTAALNWYRANYPLFLEGVDIGKIDVPVLFIWGSEDIALMRSGIEMTEDYVNGDYRFVELKAGHWLIQEAYDTVQAEITTHLKRY